MRFINLLVGITILVIGMVIFVGGFYCAAWYCFVLPIVDFITQCKPNVEIDAMLIAIDLFKLVFGTSLCLILAILGGGTLFYRGCYLIGDSIYDYEIRKRGGKGNPWIRPPRRW